MSRAFVREDDNEPPPGRFGLPPADDPAYPTASALALLEAGMDGEIESAERATGYRWGDPELKPVVKDLDARDMEMAEDRRDDRFLRAARRFLRA